jgi:hypothetical protein
MGLQSVCLAHRVNAGLLRSLNIIRQQRAAGNASTRLWSDSQTAAFITSHAELLLAPPMLLAANVMGLERSSQATAALTLDPPLEDRVARLCLALADSIASASTRPGCLLGSGPNSGPVFGAGFVSGNPASEGHLLLLKTVRNCSRTLVSVDGNGFSGWRDADEEGLQASLVPLALTRLLTSLFLPGSESTSRALLLAAEMAAAVFPSLQPWNLRLVLFGSTAHFGAWSENEPEARVVAEVSGFKGGVKVPETRLASIYCNYLEQLASAAPGYDGGEGLLVVGDLWDWLWLSLELAQSQGQVTERTAPATIIVLRYFPAPLLLAAARLCLRHQPANINAAIEACRRLLVIRLGGDGLRLGGFSGSGEDLTVVKTTQAVLVTCVQSAFKTAAPYSGEADPAVLALRLLWVAIVASAEASDPQQSAATMALALREALGSKPDGSAAALCVKRLLLALGTALGTAIANSVPDLVGALSLGQNA